MGGLGERERGVFGGNAHHLFPLCSPLFCTGIPVPPLTPLAPLLSGLPIHRLRSLTLSELTVDPLTDSELAVPSLWDSSFQTRPVGNSPAWSSQLGVSAAL